MKRVKNVLVTTKHRGVFFGQVPEDADLTATTMRLENARMAIRWGTTQGVAELASRGPGAKSKIGARATIEALHDITAVWGVSEEAAEKWLSV